MARRHDRNRNRLPPQKATDLVLVGQLASALGWSTARLRGLDDLLKPIRLSDGTRAYNVDRAIAWVRFWDEFMAWSGSVTPTLFPLAALFGPMRREINTPDNDASQRHGRRIE